MKSNTFKQELWYFGGVEEILSTFCVATCSHFLNSFSSPVVQCCSSLHFRRHLKRYLNFILNRDRNPDDWYINIMSMHEVSNCLLLTNSCLNPVVIFCTSLAFRRHLKCYLTCCCWAKSRPTDFKLTRKKWGFKYCHYFLQLQVGYIFNTDFHLVIKGNKN